MLKPKYVIYLLSIFVLFGNVCYSQEDLDTAIAKLADQISQHMAEREKTKIAIIPFPNLRNEITTLGSYLAEALTTELFNTGKFYIIERNLLNQVLEELKLSATGAIDSKSAKELGRIIGVDAIVTGTITDLGSRVAVNCRLIETQTGEIFAAASAKILKDESVRRIMAETVQISKAEEDKAKEIQVINEGDYDIEANEIEEWGGLFFGIASAKIKEDVMILNFYVRNASEGSHSFQLKELYLINGQGNKVEYLKITGLEKARLALERFYAYSKRIPAAGRIWGEITFPRLGPAINSFILNLNGKETKVTLIIK